MRHESARCERIIAEIAARQHGIITSTQLIAAGITTSGVSRRVAAGRLVRIHRGVYAVGHGGLSREGRWMAAVKSCGDAAVLSHRSAAALWGMSSSVPSLTDVMVPGYGGRKRRRGISLHRSATLLPSHCTLRKGIPVTTPARTLDDLRRVAPRREFAAALREAEYRRLPIGDQFQPDGTRTDLEARFLAICRRHRLPKPDVNVAIGPYTVDFLWREARVVVEVDGWGAHRSRSAFEADRARDVSLMRWGYTVVRFTWRQLVADARGVAQTVRALLGRS
jgi:very-short-patch-repair endonuclease